MKIKHITINLTYEEEEHFDEFIQYLKDNFPDSITSINWEQGFNTKDKV
tara:strand:+ start:214 stop:360 length:147 start_codon:yes stop_codon:yes gene_type:complete